MRKEVYDNDFVRNTFYTWTTIKQVNELSKHNILLTKSKTEKNEYSLFDFSLRDSVFKKNIFARLLKEKQFAKKRFAWTNSWATVMGWKDEAYGNHLIKIVVRNSAIVGKFNASDTVEPFSFFNLKNKKLTADFVIKNKSRIAVIYYLNYNKGTPQDRKQKRRKKTETGIHFREFVILNEKMIKNWSYGTPVIKTEMASEIVRLKQFQKYTNANQVAYRPGQCAWGNDKVAKKISNGIHLYSAATCFRNTNYLFNRAKIQKIIMKLQLALKKQSTQIVKLK